MIQLSCSKINVLKDKIDQKEIDHITFRVVSIQGLVMKIEHDGKDDQVAKSILKKYVQAIPELKMAYVKIDRIDGKGRIL